MYKRQDISKELSAWVFIISFEDTRMLAAVDAVLGVPFYITYYCADVEMCIRDSERRIDQINAVLNSYGISSIEEAEKITKDAGLDVYDQVKNCLLYTS